MKPLEEDEVAVGWREAPLGSVADIRFSSVDKKSEPREVPVRLCNYTDVYNNAYITADMNFMRATATRIEIDRFGVQVGDVIITKDSETPDDIGVAAVIDSTSPELVCGYHLAMIRPDPSAVDPTFLAKQLADWRIARYFGQQANGTTRYGLSTASIANVPLRLPSVEQQRMVGQVIRLLDLAIAQTEAVIAKLKSMRAGLLHDLLTRGILSEEEASGLPAEASAKAGQLRPPPNQAPHLYKDSPLGKIPRAWDASDVGAEFEIASGFTLGQHRRPRHHSRKYLRVANVQRDCIDLSDLAELEASDSEMTGMVVNEGDLLVVEGHANPTEIGRCALVESAAVGLTYQNHLFRLRGRRLSPRFANAWLNGESTRDHMRRTCATSSGLNTINRTQLGLFMSPYLTRMSNFGSSPPLKSAVHVSARKKPSLPSWSS